MVAILKNPMIKSPWYWIGYGIWALLVLWSMTDDMLHHGQAVFGIRSALMVGLLWMYSGVCLGWDMAEFKARR